MGSGLQAAAPIRDYPRHILYAFFLAEWAVLFGMWMLFAATVKVQEVVLGAVASFVATAAVTVVKAANFARFAPYWAELAQAWRIPGYIITDTSKILVVLIRHLLGQPAGSFIRSVNFDAGGGDPHSAGRRALAIILTSLPPNSVVFGIQREPGKTIFHQIQRSGVPAMTQRLGAKP